MKKHISLVIVALLLGSIAAQAQNNTRVLRAHYAGNVVFQTPSSGLDSICITATPPGAVWPIRLTA